MEMKEHEIFFFMCRCLSLACIPQKITKFISMYVIIQKLKCKIVPYMCIVRIDMDNCCVDVCDGTKKKISLKTPTMFIHLTILKSAEKNVFLLDCKFCQNHRLFSK